MTMSRLAALDLNSGLVCWVGDAGSGAEACKRSYEDVGAQLPPGGLREVAKQDVSANAAGFAVHQVPDDFDIEAFKAEDAVKLVRACPLVGYYQALPQAAA